MRTAPVGYRARMGILRKAAALGIAKKLYDESRKPENQRRIREAMDKMKARRAKGRRR